MDGTLYLESVMYEFKSLKALADKALAQAPAEYFFSELDERTNSLATILKHMAGNMRSRWTDFLTTDGEKPDRFRDTEFELTTNDTADAIRLKWEAGWQLLFDTIKSLTPEDLGKTVVIRTEPHSVIAAINRQLTHYGDHVGQIVLLARHYAGPTWHSVSVPRGKSEEFNAAMQKKKL